MEAGGNLETMGGGGSGGAPGNSRWNPTKEQISMLESLYRQGVRTPNAEQIQQITSRLKAYGHIEGKNVFYWFQNHKARQRQKQKQESLAYVHGFLHTNSHVSPVFSPPPPPPYPCQNVMCSTPYYLQQCGVGFYPQNNPKLILPGGIKRRPRTSNLNKTRNNYIVNTGQQHVLQQYINNNSNGNEVPNIVSDSERATLPLFPLHPTGDLPERLSRPSSCSVFSRSFGDEEEEVCGDQTVFDFFHGNKGSSQSHLNTGYW